MTDTGIDRARLREACARHLREPRETSNIGLEDAAELACMAPDELAACEAGSEDKGSSSTSRSCSSTVPTPWPPTVPSGSREARGDPPPARDTATAPT